jgi:hypothetical protein
MDDLTAAVVQALWRAPGSLRALAREAGVPHTTLTQIRTGRLGASPVVAARLGRALARWGRRCGRAAERLQEELRHTSQRRYRMRYDPRLGGHAPGHLRDAFLEWIEGGADAEFVLIDDEPKPLRWLIGQLWNCSDMLPSSECDALDLRAGSTYAQAVRSLKHGVIW